MRAGMVQARCVVMDGRVYLWSLRSKRISDINRSVVIMVKKDFALHSLDSSEQAVTTIGKKCNTSGEKYCMTVWMFVTLCREIKKQHNHFVRLNSVTLRTISPMRTEVNCEVARKLSMTNQL